MAENLKINSEIEFKINQNDIIEMLVDDRINFILEKAKEFQKSELTLKDELETYVRNHYTDIPSDATFTSIRGSGLIINEHTRLVLNADNSGLQRSMTNFYSKYEISFGIEELINGIKKYTTYTVSLDNIKEILPHIYEYLDKRDKELHEFFTKYGEIKYIDLNRNKMVKKLKIEFTRKAVTENKGLQKFLTTKFIK